MNSMRCLTLLLSFGLGNAAQGAPGEWQSLLPHIRPMEDGVAGRWSLTEGALTTAANQGARLTLPVAPTGEYDFRISFTRRTGVHSIALMFVHGGKQATFEVDAWGQHLSGIQSVGGQDIRQNTTKRAQQQLENGRRYTMTVEIRRNQIRALLDDQVLATLATDGSNLSTVDAWRMPRPQQLGIGAWESETVFHAVEVRTIDGPPQQIARTTATATPTPPRNTPNPAPNPMPAPMPGAARGKKVLIVIANQDFFYREYGDPRQELERAGVQVTVAAARKAPCRPHRGTGEGGDGGVVQADLALADAKAADYDAILFSGGWGASAYQFAFEGRYTNPAYNGDRASKNEANRLINEFVAQDKYVCALCNGVTVLAWARVNGQSPLRGKRVCAPVREAAAGIYDGRPAQPSCRWHPEQNGAVMSPPGSIGNPGTNADDVLVDGKIITGEDDPSAREMGRTLVRVLSGM